MVGAAAAAAVPNFEARCVVTGTFAFHSWWASSVVRAWLRLSLPHQPRHFSKQCCSSPLRTALIPQAVVLGTSQVVVRAVRWSERTTAVMMSCLPCLCHCQLMNATVWPHPQVCCSVSYWQIRSVWCARWLRLLRVLHACALGIATWLALCHCCFFSHASWCTSRCEAMPHIAHPRSQTHTRAHASRPA